MEFFQEGGGYLAKLAWRLGGVSNFADAIAAAKAADVAIVCASTMGLEGEGNDRPSMDLPNDQAALIRAVAAANHHTIVVLNNGTPVTMTDWLKSVPAVVEAWFPGQERRRGARGYFGRQRESVGQAAGYAGGETVGLSGFRKLSGDESRGEICGGYLCGLSAFRPGEDRAAVSVWLRVVLHDFQIPATCSELSSGNTNC